MTPGEGEVTRLLAHNPQQQILDGVLIAPLDVVVRLAVEEHEVLQVLLGRKLARLHESQAAPRQIPWQRAIDPFERKAVSLEWQRWLIPQTDHYHLSGDAQKASHRQLEHVVAHARVHEAVRIPGVAPKLI